MSMTSKDVVLAAMRSLGKADALNLRTRAPEMDGTGLIAEESKIPEFDGSKDYSEWAVGSPVWELVENERQVFTLITPHNASHYPSSKPSNTPALWSIRHTKDPKRAKAYLPPNGTSGLYEVDECAIESGHVHRNKQPQNAFSPSAMPSYWEDLGTAEDVMGGAV